MADQPRKRGNPKGNAEALAPYRFKKGESKGRPKGVRNKNTQAWEALKDDIINLHTERFNTILTQLPPDKFVNTYLQVLEYFKPKLARNENVNENYNQQLVTISIPSTATAPAFPDNIVEDAQVIETTDQGRVGDFVNAVNIPDAQAEQGSKEW